MVLSLRPSCAVDLELRGMRVGDEREEHVEVQRDVSLPGFPLVDSVGGAVHEPSEPSL